MRFDYGTGTDIAQFTHKILKTCIARSKPVGGIVGGLGMCRIKNDYICIILVGPKPRAAYTNLNTGTSGHLDLIVQSYSPSVTCNEVTASPPTSCQGLLDSIPTTFTRCIFGDSREAEECVRIPLVIGRGKCDGLYSRQTSGFFLAH